MKFLFYVSRKLAPWPHDTADVQAITAVALSRNADLDVTGVLISTSLHFAQVLEGPDDAVDAIVESIARDPRHTEMTVLDVCQHTERWYGDWALGYQGRGGYISVRIAPLMTEHPDPDGVARLLQIMRKFRPDD